MKSMYWTEDGIYILCNKLGQEIQAHYWIQNSCTKTLASKLLRCTQFGFCVPELINDVHDVQEGLALAELFASSFVESAHNHLPYAWPVHHVILLLDVFSEEIDDWLDFKHITIKFIDGKANLSDIYDDEKIIQNEIQMPFVPLSKGKYSDTGYRFRKNIMDYSNSWSPFTSSKSLSFYDIKIFNSDT